MNKGMKFYGNAEFNARVMSLQQELDDKFHKDYNHISEITNVREWCPIVYEGTFRVIGYEYEKESRFFMTEPIITVMKPGLIFQSCTKYYKLIGQMSEITFYMYYSLGDDEMKYFHKVLKPLSRRLLPTWYLNISILNLLMINYDERIAFTTTAIADPLAEVNNPKLHSIISCQDDYEAKLKNGLEDILDFLLKEQNSPSLPVKPRKSCQNILQKIDTDLNLGSDIRTFLRKAFESNGCPPAKKDKRSNAANFVEVVLWFVEPTSDGRQRLRGWRNHISPSNHKRRSIMSPIDTEIYDVAPTGRDLLTDIGRVFLLGPLSTLSLFSKDNDVMEKDMVNDVRVVLERVACGLLFEMLDGLRRGWRDYSIFLCAAKLMIINIVSKYRGHGSQYSVKSKENKIKRKNVVKKSTNDIKRKTLKRKAKTNGTL